MTAAVRAADPGETEEMLLQAHLFVGFPDALAALALWRERSGRPAPAARDEACEEWQKRGPAVCRIVYGENYPKLRRNVADIHPEMDRWMLDGGYGRVLGRGGLDLATRELCIVALLVVWDAPRQLHSHLRGALHAGASERSTQAAVEIGCAHASPPAAARARELLGRVRGRGVTAG